MSQPDTQITELHKAAYKGHKYVAETLLERGANPKAKNENGGTPLHYAAMYGRTEVAELLLGEEIDLNAKDNEGLTPLYWAKKYSRKEVVELLEKTAAHKRAVVCVCFCLHTDGGAIQQRQKITFSSVG